MTCDPRKDLEYLKLCLEEAQHYDKRDQIVRIAREIAKTEEVLDRIRRGL